MRVPVRRIVGRLYALAGMHLNRIILVTMAGTGAVISIDLLGVYAAIAPETVPLMLIGAVLFAGLRRTKPRRIVAHLVDGYSLLGTHATRLVSLAAIGGAAAIGLDLATALFAMGPEVFPLLVLAGAGLALARRIRPRLAG